MRILDEELRILLAATLVCFLTIFAIYLWFIDILARQRQFGIFLAAELVAFAMLVYVSTKPNYREVQNSWLLAGCVVLGLFLTLAIL